MGLSTHCFSVWFTHQIIQNVLDFINTWILNKRKLTFQLLWIVIGSINSLILFKGTSFFKLICFPPRLFCVSRFQEAEDDCTEALDLDDRYIKAYSRRATARKELGKIKESMEGVFILEYCACPLTTWFWIRWVSNLLNRRCWICFEVGTKQSRNQETVCRC